MGARGLCLASISSARLPGMVLPCLFGAVGSLLALAAPGQAAALHMAVCSGRAAGTALLTEPPGAQSPTRGFSRAEKPAAVGLLPSLLHSSRRRWIYRDLSISRSCFTEVTGLIGFPQPAARMAQLLRPCPKTSLLVQAQHGPGSRATPRGLLHGSSGAHTPREHRIIPATTFIQPRPACSLGVFLQTPGPAGSRLRQHRCTQQLPVPSL